MDRQDEGPPAKARRLSSSEPSQHDQLPPPPPLRLPLPPPEQRPRLREETEAAQVLADMRGVGLGPDLPPPPPYVILEEGGIRAYFTLGAGSPGWEPAMESGYGGAPPPTESLEIFSPSEASGGSVEIDFQVMEPSSFAGEKALETCSAGEWGYQELAGPRGKEEAIIIVEDDDEDEKESVRKRRRRRKRKQRKVKKDSKERNAERIECILQALENIQLDLEAVNIKAGKAFLRLKRKFIQMRRPFLERRDLIIQHIPGFWVKAFLNHPKISILINRRDEDIFRYLTNLQVQDLRHISMGYKMKLYFQTNPYFTNMVIVKEFQRNRSGRLVSHSTPIRWHRGQEPQARRHKNQDTNHSFFSWFSNHSLPEADRIAEIIKNDLWVNPLRYYMMGEGGYRANKKKQEKEESKNRDKCEVVILEDSDDYHLMEDIISETSDSDGITDNETIHDIKISDFMETTDCFETTDNEITDISECLCDSESPDHNESPDSETTDNESPDDSETTDNNESSDNTDDNEENPDDNEENTDDNNENPDGDENPDGGDENPKGGNHGSSGNNQDSSDSDNEGDNEGSDDEDNDGNEGDNEGSDDDGNEGDSEGSDDDDRDIEDYKNDTDDPDKDQDNSNNQDDYEDEVENISEEDSSVEEEEEGSEEEGSDEEEGLDEEEGIEDSEGGEDSDDSDMEEVLQVQNAWANPGKRGKTG
uniref:Testis-specific Y-encoded-like protein 2 n=1 Tax=Mustela putorius furo TaxID=9669 RepID=M3YE05_MUSPF